VAIRAARAYRGTLDDAAIAAAADSVRVPGRLQQIAEAPLTLLDGAHNPDGIAALAESLPELMTDKERLIGVVSILDDKDASRMLATLTRVCDALVFTSSQNPRALPPPTLQSLARQLSGPPSEVVGEPHAAVERARQLAGPRGVVLAAGSIYLVADLLAPAGRRRASML
jgi:dihydrofolate synthase/folylpolyglutamate synthase